METGSELQQPSLVLQMAKLFPRHVQENWIQLHPAISRAKALLLPADSEEAVRLESQITPQELIELADLRNLENGYRTRFKEQGNEVLAQEYGKIQQQKETQGATEHILRQGLALSVVAAERVYGTKDTPFSVWDTQRIALLRMTKNLLDDESTGLVLDLRTGMGKSKVVSMIFLPVGLLTKNHWDMISRTPLSRIENAKRFAPLGDVLGIHNMELTSKTARYWQDGMPYSYDSRTTDPRELAMQPNTITFATRQELTPFLLRAFSKGSSGILETIADPKNRGCLLDEIDAEAIDEGVTRFIIAGDAYPTNKMVRSYWKPLHYPQDETDSLIASGRMSEKEFNSLLRITQHNMASDIEKSQNLLSDVTTNGEVVFAFSILRKMLSFKPELLILQNEQKKYRFFSPEGRLTKAGEYDLLRRFYAYASGTSYDETQPMPQNWLNFFSMVVPAHVLDGVSEAMQLTNGSDYIVQEGNIVVQSPYTGWPKPEQEYDALTAFAIYAKESNNQQTLVYPKDLHETSDMLSSPELEAISYGKIIGLTGTGLPVAHYFRAIHKMRVTAIPSQFPETIDNSEPYIIVPPRGSKIDALKTYLHGLESKDIPILIDVTSPEQQQEVMQLLDQVYPEDATAGNIQALSATNYHEAQEIFRKAGTKGKKSVVLLMAGREVDIPVDEAVEHLGGLQVFSMAPRRIKRHEKQLLGRTGRAGRSGVYRCLVSSEDEVFSYFSGGEKKKLEKAIQQSDMKTVEKFIQQGQQRHEEQIQEQNLLFARIYGPLVRIRKRMIHCSPTEFASIRLFWQDYLTVESAQGRGTTVHAPFGRFSDETIGPLWELHALETFEKALALTNKLLQEGALSKEQIRSRVATMMASNIQDFGLSLPIPPLIKFPTLKKR